MEHHPSNSKCLTPYQVQDKLTGLYIPVPCGKCPPCKKRRVSGWSFRLMQQFKECETGYFVTMTYNTDHVPITPKGYMTLNKRDIQLFMKRLRKVSFSKSDTKIKYYCVGEYGGKTMRPHYHIILFNAEYEDIEKAWMIEEKTIGDIHYGTLTEASVGYTLKYMMKEGKIPMHANDDREPEFSLMSKGLGSNYVTLKKKSGTEPT